MLGHPSLRAIIHLNLWERYCVVRRQNSDIRQLDHVTDKVLWEGREICQKCFQLGNFIFLINTEVENDF